MSRPVDPHLLGGTVASLYRRAADVLRDIQTAVASFPTLLPHVDLYTYENGRQTNLIHLSGTVPTYFNGQTFNTPVCIWLLENHPIEPPVCYVVPAPGMCIKENQSVDMTGRIYLPCLHSWTAASTLFDVIGMMVATFSDKPPLRQTMAGQPQRPHNPLPQPAQSQPVPVTTTSQQSAQPPPRPPPPFRPPPAQLKEEEDQMLRVMRESLEDAVQSNVVRQYQQLKQEKMGAIEKENDTKNELLMNAAKVRSAASSLEIELNEALNAIKVYESKLESMPTVTSTEQPFQVDAAVVTTAPLYTQILGLQAEDNTIDDVIYHLGKALEHEKLDLEAYLKQVRIMARKQFQTRALLMKCREKAQL
eukprot:m.63028 g.63028  ORF g.63028 m.63028 type:complete len:362 (-) comp16331_c0_seq1:28-1113(-)